MELRFNLIPWFLFLCILATNNVQAQSVENKNYIQYVNPFIGTSNFGTTNPGPIAVRGMVNISPFNVAGDQNLPLEKDSRWLSTPYVHENKFLTGFSHVNLSGVGCPELGVILAMPTTGELEIDHLKYGSTYSDEISKVGYYSNRLDKYDVKVETTTATRTGISRYTFPKGKANILLNLGLGLTNEQGARVRVISPTEIEGVRTVGSFCYYKPEEAYPVYFVAKFSKPATEYGTWKKSSKITGVESQWMQSHGKNYNGEPLIKKGFMQEVVGDSIGAFVHYNFDAPTTIEMRIGVSYISIENARKNLKKETDGNSFDEVLKNTEKEWNEHLAKIEVEGGSEENKVKFYTALYHTLIHPNTLNDANGEYPKMGTRETLKTDGTRYTVFSLWDTYRNLHQLMSLVYPEQQSNMIKSMLQIYDESGWLPKWELNATETTTMVGDPAGIIIADTYLKGIRDFDVEKAYEAMLKSAKQIRNNPLRPGLEDYLKYGYLTTATTNSGSVSTTQEYNISDYAIAQLAKKLGKKNDFKHFSKRSISYRKLLDKDLNLLRPKNEDGSWVTPYDPNNGANFVKNLGFIEGNAWQYTFMAPHDIPGLIKLMGGKKKFVRQLEKVFDSEQFDMANEPDIMYPYLFNYVPGQEFKTQEKVQELLTKHYQNLPEGLPGNDDTGTMSAWAVFSMMGIYPINPANPVYALTTPSFNKITLHLNKKYYHKDKIVISKNGKGQIKQITAGDQKLPIFFISHQDLVNSNALKFYLRP
ncbi:GH92 family glycosyl hydrolase [Maribacter sp. 2304DJ31-5]|uniref:GH92 family glycosyl hydrolase n=1 Tax=Maribacter sp. 2304DJ31-5 TaxID=3386273 RepID=UPI0039BC30B1